jgi:hypothetical protein
MLLVAIVALPGRAQVPTVDDLLRAALAPKPSELYTMHADFNVVLTVRYAGSGLLTATAQGTLIEQHRPGEPLHRALGIREIHVPLVLRPFTGLVQRIIRERIETQPDDLPDVHADDFFLLDSAGGGYTIGGVRRDIVTRAMAAYASVDDGAGDREMRRSVAKWLFTSPLMKDRLVRPGPPYALEGVVDTHGLLRGFMVFYNWGTLRTQIDYAMISGAPVWDRLQTDVAGKLPTLGPVTGDVTIALSHQCLDCATKQTVPDLARGRQAVARADRNFKGRGLSEP